VQTKRKAKEKTNFLFRAKVLLLFPAELFFFGPAEMAEMAEIYYCTDSNVYR
jgi:hypothetical protein